MRYSLLPCNIAVQLGTIKKRNGHEARSARVCARNSNSLSKVVRVMGKLPGHASYGGRGKTSTNPRSGLAMNNISHVTFEERLFSGSTDALEKIISLRLKQEFAE